MTVFMAVFGGVLAGMACVFVSFLVFKPVLMKFTDAMLLSVRLNEESIVRKVSDRMQIPTVQSEKAPKKSVFKPRRDVDEDVK